MKIVRDIRQMRGIANKLSGRPQSIGFVPTMGCLHDGHLALAQRAKRENDIAVMSIFINPKQFGPNEDLATYPRNLRRDIRLAKNAGVDILFAPSACDIYPKGYATYVNIEGLTTRLCGRSRPGHFRGVATIVLKLLSIVRPDRAYFGQKDAQQAFVIRRMITDLNLPVRPVIVPTVRENDGLAMSSRNVYLTPRQRHDAPVLYKALMAAKKRIKDGERCADRLILSMRSIITGNTPARIDYIEIVSTGDLQPVKNITGEILIACAVFFGKTRLIDNIIAKV